MARYFKILSFFFLLVSFCLILTSCNEIEVVEKEKIGKIVIGCDEYSPYFFINEDGEFDGIDFSLACEACNRLGYETEFKLIDWTDKDKELESGRVDCLWGAFTIQGLEEKYLWAGPYFESRPVLVVLENSDINTISDLSSKRIGVQVETKTDDIFSKMENENLPKIKELYCFEDMNLAFAALRKGYVDAVGGHEEVMLYNINNSIPDYRVLDETLFVSELGVAFKKDYDKDFVRKLTSVLNDLHDEGFIDEEIKKYNSKGAVTFWYM